MEPTNLINPRMVEACQAVKPALCNQLVTRSLLTSDQVWNAAIRYRLGATRDDGTVFWQIDSDGNVHDGRIAFHTSDCDTDRTRPSAWVSTRLKANGTLPREWQRTDCLFGEHLLSTITPNDVVAIIESEKSAVICSALFSEVTWLATGEGVSLTVETLTRLHRVSHGASMILFPKTDPNGQCFRRWEEIAITASVRNTKPIYVWDMLEKINDDAKKGCPDLVGWLTGTRVRRQCERIGENYV